MNKLVIASVAIILFFGGIFYFRYQVYYSHGVIKGDKVFEIKEGEGNMEVADNLEKQGLISGKWYFYYYLRTHGKLNKIMPGEYELSGNSTIPELVNSITEKKDLSIKVTFPEGWNDHEMAARLKENDLPGDDFLAIANDPSKWDFRNKYDFLKDGKMKSLEGYLFPDTYFFKKDVSAEDVITKMLDNFETKITPDMEQALSGRNVTLNDAIILASIVEKEVQTAADMKLVAGIFVGRIANGQRLQSDAPLSYILNDNKSQHSGKDLDFDSPYNTYRNAGLPPGPIDNPGMNAILAAIYPQASGYNYFLTATINGQKKVMYAKTYDEHLQNKQKAGL